MILWICDSLLKKQKKQNSVKSAGFQEKLGENTCRKPRDSQEGWNVRLPQGLAGPAAL